MNLTRLRDILENHKGLVLAGAAILILSVWVLIPERVSPEKLQGLLERENFPAVREGALQALAREPKAHEIRALLIEACLEDGRYTEAMEHLLILNSSGWDIKELELQFFMQISAIAQDAGESSALLALLAAKMPEHPGWNWVKAFGLQVLDAGGGITMAPAYLAGLCPEDVGSITHLLKPVWRTAAESADWETAWQTAGILDPLLKAAEDAAEKKGDWETVHKIGSVADLGIDLRYAWHLRMVSSPNDYVQMLQGTDYPGYMCRLGFLQSNFGGNQEKWAVLQEKYPEDPLLACTRGLDNLDWLAEWESLHPIGKDDKIFYSSLKAQLIARADSVEIRHFLNVLPSDLLEAVLRDAVNKPKLAVALDYLHSDPYMKRVVDTARLALDAPGPVWTLENYPRAIMSGDGNGLIITEPGQDLSDRDKIKYLSLETGEEFTLPEDDIIWSPDGSRVAVQAWVDTKYHFRVYTKQGELIQECPGGINQETIQWRDSTSLWLVKRELKPEGNMICLYILDLTDGSVQRADSIPNIQDTFFGLSFGPRGRLAWVEGQDLRVFDGAKIITLTYQGEFCRILGWRPDARGMVVATEISGLEITMDERGEKLMTYITDQSHIMTNESRLLMSIPASPTYYYEIGRSLEELDCALTNCSWLSNSEFAGEYSLSSGQNMLGIYNLKTGKTTLTGIVNPISVAGGRVLTRGVDALYVYELGDLQAGE